MSKEFICKESYTDNGGYLEPEKELVRCEHCYWCRAFYHGPAKPLSYECSKLYLTGDLKANDFCSRGVFRR